MLGKKDFSQIVTRKQWNDLQKLTTEIVSRTEGTEEGRSSKRKNNRIQHLEMFKGVDCKIGSKKLHAAHPLSIPFSEIEIIYSSVLLK